MDKHLHIADVYRHYIGSTTCLEKRDEFSVGFKHWDFDLTYRVLSNVVIHAQIISVACWGDLLQTNEVLSWLLKEKWGWGKSAGIAVQVLLFQSEFLINLKVKR